MNIYKQPGSLLRRRVAEALRKAGETPLAIVCAGAGYGKTTAMKQFLEGEGLPHLYMTLKPIHNLPEALWLEFLTQMDDNFPEYAAQFRKIGAPIEVTQFGAFVQVMQAIIRQYGRLYFVLDDFYQLTEPQTLRFVKQAIQFSMPGLKVYWVTRSEPAVDISELDRDGLVTWVGPQELAFQEEEIAAFMAPRLGEANARLVRHIRKQTDGWPMAVMLLYHTLAPERSLDDSMDDVRPMMHSTIDRLFFSDYPYPLKRGLILASLCETIYPGLVTTIQDFSLSILRELALQNPFINIGREGEFWLHTLYKEFLNAKTGLLPEEDIRRHYNAVGDWLLENGHTLECISAYRKAGNYMAVWHALKSLHGERPSRSLAVLCSEVFEETPREVFEADGYILLYAVLILLCSRQSGKARELLRDAGEKYTRDGASHSMAGEYHLLYGLSLFVEYDTGFLVHWRKADTLLEEGSRLVDRRFRLLYTMPLFAHPAIDAGSVARFHAACDEGLPLLAKNTGGCGLAIGEKLRGEACYYLGDFAGAIEEYEKGLCIAQQAHQHDVCISTAFQLFHAYVHCGRFEDAARCYALIRESSLGSRRGDMIHPIADAALQHLEYLLGNRPIRKPVVDMDNRRLLTYVRGLYAPAIMLEMAEDESGYHEALRLMQDTQDELRRRSLHIPGIFMQVLGSYICARLGMNSYSYLLLEEAYQASDGGRYITPVLHCGSKALLAIEHYRMKKSQQIPASWLDMMYGRTQAWIQHLATASAYQQSKQLEEEEQAKGTNG